MENLVELAHYQSYNWRFELGAYIWHSGWRVGRFGFGKT